MKFMKFFHIYRVLINVWVIFISLVICLESVYSHANEIWHPLHFGVAFLALSIILIVSYGLPMNSRLMKDYNESYRAIFEHVGIRCIPDLAVIDDMTFAYWSLSEDGTKIKYSMSKSAFDDGLFVTVFDPGFPNLRPFGGNKWPHPGRNITLVYYHIHRATTNRFCVFDNSKRLPHIEKPKV